MDEGLQTRQLRETLAGKLFGNEAAEVVRVGRYVIVERLGQGAFGAVYSAYDPKLDRRVAVKVIPFPPDTPREDRDKMLLEGRALARVAHPNVVAIYEVGEQDNAVFLVMEHASGGDLAKWIAETPLTNRWRTALPLLRAAARGLAAVHDQSLVHRDFKPSNVLLFAGGVAKIADFGFTRLATARGESTLSEGRTSASSSALSVTDGAASPQGGLAATTASSVAGTPVYMAPERLAGGPATPATDVFAFAVALWEALYGERPWPGLPFVERLRPVPAGAGRVPRWLHRIAADGLTREADDRQADASVLVRQLDRGVPRSRKVIAASGLFGAGAVVAASVGSAEGAPCQGGVEQLRAVVSDERIEAIGTRFAALGTASHTMASRRVADALRVFADQWLASQHDACMATAVHKEQSVTALVRRMACLHDELRRAAELVAVFETADRTTVHRSHQLLADLRSVERCDNLEALMAETPLPADPDALARVHGLRAAAARALARERVGRFDEATAALDEAEREFLDGLEYEPVHNEFAFARGRNLRRLGRYEDARPLYERAYQGALRWGQWQLAADIANHLSHLASEVDRKPAEGLALARTALGLGTREHAPARAEPAALHSISIAMQALGRHDEAEQALRESMALDAAALGEVNSYAGAAHHDLGVSLHRRGRLAEAEAEFRAALQAHESELGAIHPQVAGDRTSLGVTLKAQGRPEEAEHEYREALAILEKTVGLDHERATLARTNLASALAARGKLEAAESLYRQGLATTVRDRGEDHPDVAMMRRLLAINLLRQERFDEADVEITAALANYEARLGPSHPDTARVRANVGVFALTRGHFTEAEAPVRRALKDLTAALGEDDQRVVTAHINLAQVLNGLSRGAEAEVHARAALRFRERRLDPGHASIRETRFELAAALRLQGHDDDALEQLDLAWKTVPAEIDHDQDRASTVQIGLSLAKALRGTDNARATAIMVRVRERANGVSLPEDVALELAGWASP